MLIDQVVAEDGRLLPVALEEVSAGFALYRGKEKLGVLSARIISEVVKRYARPLEANMAPEGEGLKLANGRMLVAWYYKSPVDLEDKLYLVLEQHGQPPIAVLSRQVASALIYLSRG